MTVGLSSPAPLRFAGGKKHVVQFLKDLNASQYTVKPGPEQKDSTGKAYVDHFEVQMTEGPQKGKTYVLSQARLGNPHTASNDYTLELKSETESASLHVAPGILEPGAALSGMTKTSYSPPTAFSTYMIPGIQFFSRKDRKQIPLDSDDSTSNLRIVFKGLRILRKMLSTGMQNITK